MGSLVNGATLLGYQFGDGIKAVIMALWGPMLWGLCDLFFVLLDIFELIFKKLAGMDKVSVNGETVEGDIVLYLIKSDVVQNVFYSILALSLFLLIIFTVVAIVKNQYIDKPKPVMNIISDSFKGLLMYLLVPIATIACLMVGNVILQGIDGATRANTSEGASDMLFITAAYNANILRTGSFEENRKELKSMYNSGLLNGITIELANLGIKSAEDIETLTEESGGSQKIERIATIIDYSFTDGTLIKFSGDKWNYIAVVNYYNPFRISLLTVWIGGGFLIWAIGKMAWGVASRLFKMTLGFAISPIFMALYPLNGGKELGSWKSDMVKNGTMAYCAVGVLNILYSILPLFMELNIFSGIGTLWGQIVKLFLVIVAYSGASSLVGTVSGWFGTGDALKEGKDQASALKGTVKGIKDKIGSGRKKVIGTFQGIRAGRKLADEAGKNKFLGGLAGAYKGSGLADSFIGIDPAAIGKEWNDAKKNAEEYYKSLHTNTFNADTNKANKALFEELEYRDKLKKRMEAIGKYVVADDTGENTPGAIEAARIRKDILATGEGKWAVEARDIEQAIKQKELESVNAYKALIDGLGDYKDKIDEVTAELGDLNTALSTTTDADKIAELNLQISAKNRELAGLQSSQTKAQNAVIMKLEQDSTLQSIANSMGNVVTVDALGNKIIDATADLSRLSVKLDKESTERDQKIKEFALESEKIQVAAAVAYSGGDKTAAAERKDYMKRHPQS